jgi:hypothetical protein
MSGAVSADIADISFTSGTGTYLLSHGVGGKQRLSQAYPSGEPITVYVTDSAGFEVVRGVLDGLGNTLTRPAGSVIASSNGGSLVSWPATGQRLIQPLVGGTYHISFCTVTTFAAMSTDPYDDNYEIFDDVLATSVTFLSNFLGSPTPGCEVAPNATVTITFQKIHLGAPTTIGTMMIGSGSTTGSLSSSAITIPAGDRVRAYASSSVDSTIAGVFGKLVGFLG